MQDAKGRTLKIDIRSLGLDKPVSARLPRPGAPSFAKEAGFDYRFIFETLYDAVLITDAKGVVTSFNGRALELFGYSQEGSLKGIPLRQLVGGVTDAFVQSVGETVAARRHMRVQAFAYRMNGEMAAVEMVIGPARENSADSLLFLLRDIQARYHAEQVLQSAYHAMDSTDSGIALATLEGQITYANRAFVAMLGGGDEANVLEKPLSTWFDQAEIVKPALDRAMSGERWSGEGKPANRSDMTVQVSVVPDIDADGVLQAVIVSVTDATLRLRAELAEFQLDRDRAMMESLSEACHAIGQPATVLLTSIEMLRDAPDMDVETRKAIYDMCYSAMMELRQHLQEMNAARLSVKEDLMPSGTKATSGAAFYSGNADAQPNA